MHPVLQAAIDNPRMPRPYGSDRGDIAYNQELSTVDAFIKRNTDWRDLRAANDNFERTH